MKRFSSYRDAVVFLVGALAGTLAAALVILTFFPRPSPKPTNSPHEPLRTLSLEGISRAEQIIGQLGKPLGTVVEVKGTVRIRPGIGKSGSVVLGRTLILSHIDNKSLDEPLELEIFPTVSHELKQGEILDCRAYERVMTDGDPPGVPRPEVRVQATAKETSYHLSRYLELVDENEDSPFIK